MATKRGPGVWMYRGYDLVLTDVEPKRFDVTANRWMSEDWRRIYGVCDRTILMTVFGTRGPTAPRDLWFVHTDRALDDPNRIEMWEYVPDKKRAKR